MQSKPNKKMMDDVIYRMSSSTKLCSRDAILFNGDEAVHVGGQEV